MTNSREHGNGTLAFIKGELGASSLADRLPAFEGLHCMGYFNPTLHPLPQECT